MARGQVSAELIIIIAAVLAVALILVVQLQKTAAQWSNQTEATNKKLQQETGTIGELAKCQDDSDCPDGYCQEGSCVYNK